MAQKEDSDGDDNLSAEDLDSDDLDDDMKDNAGEMLQQHHQMNFVQAQMQQQV